MYFQRDLLAGRVAVVTGGGTGICRAIALAFAEHGCDVAITSRRLEHLEATVQELEAHGRRAVALPADVRDPNAVEQVMRRVGDEFGRLDIVVNGAAGNFVCLAENLSPNGFSTVVDIDLKGTFNVSTLALPYLRRRGGVVLNISATLQYLGTIGQAHAASAKAGVDALTRTLAAEWGPIGIRVNGLAPGPTEGTEGMRRLTGDKRDTIIQQTPLRRLASREDVAQAALFLCSDAAAFTNGVTLVVDGGLWLASSRVMSLPAEAELERAAGA